MVLQQLWIGIRTAGNRMRAIKRERDETDAEWAKRLADRKVLEEAIQVKERAEFERLQKKFNKEK